MRQIQNFIALLFLAVTAHAATDTFPVMTSTSAIPVVPVQRSPAVPDVVLQGQITAIDAVSQKLEVHSSSGTVQTFLMGTTTPIADHFIPIGFKDLHVGDHVAVHYSTLPYVINRIDKQ